jgi:hypothetical protein
MSPENPPTPVVEHPQKQQQTNDTNHHEKETIFGG